MEDLNGLSDEILVQIVSNLPFNDLVRFGLVSKRWLRISKHVISRTTTLDIKDTIFQKLTPESLSALLELCSMNLEKLVYPPPDFKRTDVFGGFEYPNLVELDMGASFYTSVTLGAMLQNARNLEVLKYSMGCDDTNIGDVILGRLKTLVTFHGSSLVFLIGRVPNLKNLEFHSDDTCNLDTHNINDFIAQCPAIQTIKSRNLAAGSAFWNLDLHHLFIRDFRDKTAPNADPLLKIGRVFRNLVTLELGDETTVTNDGLMALATCKNLQKVSLKGPINGWLDDGVRAFDKCKKLELLQINGCIHSETLITVVNEIHSLKMFVIWYIEPPVDVISFVQSFHRFGSDLTIGIFNDENAQIWTSEQKHAEESFSVVKFQEGWFI